MAPDTMPQPLRQPPGVEDVALPAAFADRILPVDTAVARRSAGLHVPDPRPIRDALIAATALVRQLVVVTRDVADFAPTGAQVIDPWLAQPSVASR
jgi:hypothetical protein